MNKNDQILLLLGRVQARIEDLGQWALSNHNPVFSFVADLEGYFNKSVNEIFSDEEKLQWREGIKWNTLPR